MAFIPDSEWAIGNAGRRRSNVARLIGDKRRVYSRSVIQINASYSLVPVAETGRQFSDFGPYVAAINDAGSVAFQATLTSGGSGVFTGDGNTIHPQVQPGEDPIHEVLSHPDISLGDGACFYGREASGRNGVYHKSGREIVRLYESFGPLGPTMNAAGQIAFRAAGSRDGQELIAAVMKQRIHPIAETGKDYRAFHGLPLMSEDGRVVFRADRSDGVQGIYVADKNRIAPAVETGAGFDSLGAFPSLDEAGRIVFCATRDDGEAGAYRIEGGRPRMLVGTTSGFESIRGALHSERGIVFYATPRGGRLGIYTGPDPLRDRLSGLGDALPDSTIAEFALNPVSINRFGNLAIRTRLENGRQLILRADPIATA